MESVERAVSKRCRLESALRDALLSEGKVAIDAITFFSNFGIPLNLSGKATTSFRPKLREIAIPISYHQNPRLRMKYCEVGLRYERIDRVVVVNSKRIINVKFKDGDRLVMAISFPLDTIEEVSTAVMNLELLTEVAEHYPELRPHLLILKRIWGNNEALLAEVGRKFIASCAGNPDYYVTSEPIAIKIPVDGKVLKEVWLYREVAGVNMLGELMLEKGFRAMLALKVRKTVLYIPVPSNTFGELTMSSLASLLENEGVADDVAKLREAVSTTGKALAVFAGTLFLLEKT